MHTTRQAHGCALIRIAILTIMLSLSTAFPSPVAAAVGFQRLTYAAPSGRVEVGIWYPSDGVETPEPLGLYKQNVLVDGPVHGRDLPLVVISHGTGGSLAGHYDTAIALAKAGFVVAALTHPGDNYRDDSRAM
jgi:predicted dienelactone hydrolase